MYFLNMFNKLIKLLFLFGIILTTSNCSTGSSGETVLGRPGSPMWFKTASRATKVEYFQSICNGYGYKLGSNTFADCMRDVEKTALNNARQIQRDSDRNFSKFYESLNKSRNDYNNSINNSSNNNNRLTNCSYESEFVSGYNKICSYNCRGSLSTLTIGQYQQCPSYLR